jgi:hypothetical protein
MQCKGCLTCEALDNLRVLDTGATSGAMLKLIGKAHIPTHATLQLLLHLVGAAAPPHPAAMILITPTLLLHGQLMPAHKYTSNLRYTTTITTTSRFHDFFLSTAAQA